MSERLTVLKLTPEQSAQILHLLNQGQNVFGELRLANLPGEQSAPHIFLGLLSTRTANKVRDLIQKDANQSNQPNV